MTIKRLETSNPLYTPDNTQLLTVHSSHLQRRHDVSIYNIAAGVKDIPIIILLHGVYGNHWVWMHLGGVHYVYESLRKQLGLGEFLLVMPSDGGIEDGSAYLPTSSYGNYEKWIMEDVVSAVIESTSGATINSNIYLTGLSMGGYGALRLGAKYPNKVRAISAHSAITQLSQINDFTETALELYDCSNENEHDILYWLQLNKNTLPPLRFDCGNEDALLAGNNQLHQALTMANIPHQFDTFSGQHDWEYWHEHIKDTFLFFHNIEYPSSPLEE